jgi:hypothetical protein
LKNWRSVSEFGTSNFYRLFLTARFVETGIYIPPPPPWLEAATKVVVVLPVRAVLTSREEKLSLTPLCEVV